MSYDIQTIDTHVDLLKVLLWQYGSGDGESIEGLLKSKSEWYELYISGFWENWYSDVFDIRTANEFGLVVWATILGVSFEVPDCPSKSLNLEQKRLVIRLRFYQVTTRATIPMVNAELLDVFGEGEAYALDPLDMSSITYVFKTQPSPDVALVLSKYDLLPRPSAVGVVYRVASNTDVFGFGEDNQNFENGAFYAGDVLISYGWDLSIQYDESTGYVSGALGAEDTTQTLGGRHIAVTYTNKKTAKKTTNDVVTNSLGKWSDTKSPREGGWSVTAKTQIDTEICTVIDVQSPTIEYDHTDYEFTLEAAFDKAASSVKGALKSNQAVGLEGQSVVITYTPDAANGEGQNPIGHTVKTSVGGVFIDLATPSHGRYSAAVSSNVVIPSIDVSATIHGAAFEFVNIEYTYGLSVEFNEVSRAIEGQLSVNQPLPSIEGVSVRLTYARADGSGEAIINEVTTDSTGRYVDPSPPTGYDYKVYAATQMQGPFETSAQAIKSETIVFAATYTYAIEIRYDDISATIKGKITASGGDGLEGQLITLSYTDVETAAQTVRQVETLADGSFSDGILLGSTFSVVAQCDFIPPYGGSVQLISNTVRYRYVIPGAKVVMVVSSVDRALCVINAEEVSSLRVDYGDGQGAGSRFNTTEISATGSYAIFPASDVRFDSSERRNIEFQYTSSIRFTDSTQNYAGGRVSFNPLVELISVTSSARVSIERICYRTKLEKIHNGAFADLPNLQSCLDAFSSLTSKSLHIPGDMFASGAPVSTMERAFAYNGAVVTTFGTGFLDNIAATLQNIAGLFRNGSNLEGVLNDIATVRLPSLIYAELSFSYCSGLTGSGYDFINSSPLLVLKGSDSNGVTAAKSTGLMFQHDRKLSDYSTMPYELTGETNN